MRQAEGGGRTPEDRARREDVRLQAARLFEQDMDVRRIARILRVSTKPVYQWRRAWRAGGDSGLAARGQGGDGGQLGQIPLAPRGARLEAGPGACRLGANQRWALAPGAALVVPP